MVQIDEIIELSYEPTKELSESLPTIYSSKTKSLSQKITVFEEYSFIKKYIQDVNKGNQLSSYTKSILNDYNRLFEETDKKIQQKIFEEIDDVAVSLKENRTTNYEMLYAQAERLLVISDSLQYNNIKKELKKTLSLDLKKKLSLNSKISFYDVYVGDGRGLVVEYIQGGNIIKKKASAFAFQQRSKPLRELVKKSLSYASIFLLGAGLSYGIWSYTSSGRDNNRQQTTTSFSQEHLASSENNLVQIVQSSSEKKSFSTEEQLANNSMSVTTNTPTTATVNNKIVGGKNKILSGTKNVSTTRTKKKTHSVHKKHKEDEHQKPVQLYNWVGRGGK